MNRLASFVFFLFDIKEFFWDMMINKEIYAVKAHQSNQKEWVYLIFCE